jgi:glyoxylase-like metal-dependent hydrolase (beta-lactamase superfamily II)
MHRRTFLRQATSGLFGAAVGSWAAWYWLGGALSRPFRSAAPDNIATPPVTVTTRSGVRIHGIQTGLLAIKRAHASLRGPEALRLLTIIQDTSWTPLLPILTWVIEHPEGLIVIDTGERAAASDIDTYMANDPANRWFFKRNLPLFVTPAEELATQMCTLGLAPEAVRKVMLTHLHGDHAGGLGFFPNATFLVARAEYEGQLRQPKGAVRSLWPIGFAPQLVDYTGPALGTFSATLPLTRSADVLLTPTPGHSYGHQSVVLQDGEGSHFFAGDLAFSEGQLRAQGLQGIAQNLDQARDTLARTLRYVRDTPTVFLHSHDPQSLERLRGGIRVIF